jgi:SAM-dependent methyltransferase
MLSTEIDHVSDERWKAAQQWENAHWVNAQRMRAKFGKNYIWRVLHLFGLVPKHRGDDWNSWWRDQFDGYRFLPAAVDNAIEVGCGPYTNIRLVQERCRPRHLVLSDPLIRTYVGFKLTFVAEAYRKAFCVLDDHPLEELPFASDYFDLAVMINVLDHVRDARRCMENLTRVIKPGGTLIVGQDLTNEEDFAKLKDEPGAIGHPIKLTHQWFDPYLRPGFEPLIDKLLPREQGREPHQHYGTLVFAGRKRAVG